MSTELRAVKRILDVVYTLVFKLVPPMPPEEPVHRVHILNWTSTDKFGWEHESALPTCELQEDPNRVVYGVVIHIQAGASGTLSKTYKVVNPKFIHDYKRAAMREHKPNTKL